VKKMPKRPAAKLMPRKRLMTHQGQERDWIRYQAAWQESL
jgi:hypothetical protein